MSITVNSETMSPARASLNRAFLMRQRWQIQQDDAGKSSKESDPGYRARGVVTRRHCLCSCLASVAPVTFLFYPGPKGKTPWAWPVSLGGRD